MTVDHIQALALQVLTGVSVAMPFLEWLAKQTKTTADDEAVSALEKILSYVPAVRLGGKK